MEKCQGIEVFCRESGWRTHGCRVPVGLHRPNDEVRASETRLRAGAEWSDSIHDQQNACLAIGLQLWMRWYREGARKLGDTHYFGEAPILGDERYFDVVRTTVGELNCMVYLDRDTSRIRLIEMQADSDRDVAEVYFEYGDATQDLLFPSKLRLVFGTESRIEVALDATKEWQDPSETSQ